MHLSVIPINYIYSSTLKNENTGVGHFPPGHVPAGRFSLPIL